MAIASIDEVMLREPRLLVPGMQPLGPVKVDKSHIFATGCKAFYCASYGPKNLVNGKFANTSGLSSLVQSNGNVALDFSSSTCFESIGGVALPFVLACRVNFDSITGPRRIIHLTKDTGVETIAGIQLGSFAGQIVAQNYDGNNDTSGGLVYVTTGVWYDLFFIISSSILNVSVNGTDDNAGAPSWTSGQNRLSFGFADWNAGSEMFDGKVEWFGYWSGDLMWGQRVNGSSFRTSPYQFLTPA